MLKTYFSNKTTKMQATTKMLQEQNIHTEVVKNAKNLLLDFSNKTTKMQATTKMLQEQSIHTKVAKNARNLFQQQNHQNASYNKYAIQHLCCSLHLKKKKKQQWSYSKSIHIRFLKIIHFTISKTTLSIIPYIFYNTSNIPISYLSHLFIKILISPLLSLSYSPLSLLVSLPLHKNN